MYRSDHPGRSVELRGITLRLLLQLFRNIVRDTLDLAGRDSGRFGHQLLPARLFRTSGGRYAGRVDRGDRRHDRRIFAGFFAGGLVGVILGPFFGAVIGELIHDRSDSAKAFRSGFGSFLAFIAGTGLKLVAAIWMICLVWSDTYPVVKNWIVTTF